MVESWSKPSMSIPSGIHVGESERTFNFVHAAFASPLLDGVDECTADVEVVNKINPPEAYYLFVPGFIGTVVDDGSHTAHDFAVAHCQKVVGLAKFECCILLRRKGVEHVVVEVGYGVGVVFVKFVIEADEFFQLRLIAYFLDFNGHGRGLSWG